MYAESSYHSILHLFQRTFNQLNRKASAQQLESLCSIIHQVMSARERRFHTEQHILEMSSSDCEGVETLSILCHDLVYSQIDKRLHPLLLPFLKGFELDENYHIVLPRLENLPSYSYANLVYEVFGFEPLHKLTVYDGLNEFLSAFAAVGLLKDLLNEWETIQLIACIEGTIPFRPKTDSETSPSQLLAQRLSGINQSLQLQKSTLDITKTVQMSVEVSNRDVSGFGASSPGEFLNGTWKLIIESNPPLRNPLYTVSEYRNALAKMEGFFSFLRPEIIFREYQNTPPPRTYSKLLKKTSENLKIGIQYLQAKIVASDVLQAVCDLTTGAAPILLFTGAVNQNGTHFSYASLEHYLDKKIPILKDKSRNQEVVKLLKIGRTESSTFDLKHSPIAAFIYDRVSTDDFEKLIQFSRAFGTKQISAMDYLNNFSPKLICALLISLSKIAETRTPKILEIVKEIEGTCSS